MTPTECKNIISICDRKITIDTLVRRIGNKTIRVQNQDSKWNNIKKSCFIESLMLGIPIGNLTVLSNKDNEWTIMDGTERVSTILEFINNEFTLENMTYFKGYNKKFDNISGYLFNVINNTELDIFIINPDNTKEVIQDIVSRIQ